MVFHLDESMAAAGKMLEKATGILPNWRKVCENWLEKKRWLIDNLDPQTGRREVDVAAPVSVESVTRALVTEFGSLYWCTALSQAEWQSGRTNSDNYLCRNYKAKPNQNLSRALAGIAQRQLKITADRASARIGKVFDSLKSGTCGKLVLSANILDMLSCSENCSYASCHSLSGSYRAGPQQYLADDSTMVAYFYKEERGGAPYKTWRQIIHVNRDVGALFMTNYGTPINEACHKELRRLVVTAMTGGTDCKWTLIKRLDWKWLLKQSPLAHIDKPLMAIVFGDKRPEFRVSDRLPCGRCGNLVSPDSWHATDLKCWCR